MSVEILNSEEDKAVEELQMRMKNYLSSRLREDPTVFYRFLKARDFDIEKAEKMLRKHLTWRKINQSDIIMDHLKPLEMFVDYFEPSHIGYDKDGAIIVYIALGKVDVIDLFKSIKMNDFMKHLIWFAEKHIALLQAHNVKTGKKAYQGNIIMDLDKLTFANTASKLTLAAFLRTVNMYQDNFPERLKSVYIINAPSYYALVYSVLKTVMSSALINKIHIMAYSGWKEKFLEFIDADVLPAYLGGNRTDPDGDIFCKSFMRYAGKMPEKYILSHEDRYFRDIAKVKKLCVSSSEKKEINLDVDEVGSEIHWEFMVKGKDVGFGLYYRVSDHRKKEVIPLQKYDTSDGTERDHYKCLLAGRYVVVFDNSYSWLNSKEVEFCISISKPKPDEHPEQQQAC